jgi:hypothetical protein
VAALPKRDDGNYQAILRPSVLTQAISGAAFIVTQPENTLSMATVQGRKRSVVGGDA